MRIIAERKQIANVSKVVLLDWSDLPDEIKASVERGLAQSKAGKTTPHAEVMKKYKKYLIN